ncbi:MAG TPA: class II aldolase/adducin family protein [Verrucomicrobiae bacterium]|jgi:ribulose-5-phosphate 4-epimerase/fuculose-1-phosphate aldolase|nr:class II aldolase/adducin family protein [Verrucomicrobiae bacterium]
MAKSRTIAELRKKVALSCRIVGAQGLTRGALGHVSARIPHTDRILIKGKGVNEEAVEFASERDIITVDLEGRVLDKGRGLEAPNESAMHLAIYRKRPEVMSVIHTHPDWIVALTACDKPLVPLYAAYSPAGMRLAVEGIPIYPRSVTIVDQELAEDFMRTMGEKKACLLAGHGMTVAGSCVEEATATSLHLYELARVNAMAYAIGQPKSISEADIFEYRRRAERSSGPLRESSTRFQSEWRYQLKLLARRR